MYVIYYYIVCASNRCTTTRRSPPACSHRTRSRGLTCPAVSTPRDLARYQAAATPYHLRKRCQAGVDEKKCNVINFKLIKLSRHSECGTIYLERSSYYLTVNLLIAVSSTVLFRTSIVALLICQSTSHDRSVIQLFFR